MRATSDPGPRREEGVVLILVLTIIVFTISGVYSFYHRSVLEVASTRARTERVRAELLARSGIPIGLRALQDDAGVPPASEAEALAQTATQTLDPLGGIDSPLDGWALLGQSRIEVPEGNLHVRVDDAGSRVNLNGLIDAGGDAHTESREFLTASLAYVIEHMPGRDEEKLYDPEELADAVLDWLDSDDRTRLNDAEEDAYASAGSGALPVNRPVWTLDELTGVPGMDPLLLEALRLYFTSDPQYPKQGEDGGLGGGVNPNTAPPHLLGMIYHGVTGDKRLLDEDDVFRLLKVRSEGRVFCPTATGDPACVAFGGEIGRDGSAFPPLAYASEVFAIDSVARIGEARACVHTVVQRDGAEMTTLDYRMGC